MIYHHHLLLNGYSTKNLEDCENLCRWLEELVKEIGMKVVIPARAFYVDKEGNKGITGQIGLETSHISIHVWDECNPSMMRLDIYTCGCLDVKQALSYLSTSLQLTKYEYMVLNRDNGFVVTESGVSK